MERCQLWRRVLLLAGVAGAIGVLWISAPLVRRGPNVASAGSEPTDCNGNGIGDEIDLASGTSLDCDGNGVPDECDADGESLLSLELIAEGLTFAVAIEPSPHATDRLLVGLKGGRVMVVDLTKKAVLLPPLLDISSRVTTSSERGMLSLAFDPTDAGSQFLYLTYNEKMTGALRVSRFPVSEDGLTADPDAEEILVSVQPLASSHNGGQLRFGPDGMLYVATGDGTTYAQSDPQNNAQSGGSLLGKLLRLDVDAPPEFVPADNPYVDDPGVRDEIWARGLRNPWRFSFDRLTGDLFLADVGLNDREEINVVPAGAGGQNFGWRCLEGTLCTGFDAPCACEDRSLTAPAYEIERSGGCWAIIGGFVYRGCEVPALHGRYLYANYCNGSIYSLRVSRDKSGAVVLDDERDHTAALNPHGLTLLTTFGEGHTGELYFVSIYGSLWRISPAADCNGNGVDDATDIADATSEDCNDNLIPDECEEDPDGDGVLDGCRRGGDVNGDGVVNVDDLLAVITSWGTCPEPPDACPADVNGDGVVDVDDLTQVILNWG